MIYDLIIIGMGPAGVTAAIYAKRAGLNVLCFENAMIGGYLNYIDRVDNYPGLYGVSGPDFAFNLMETINKLDIEVKREKVMEIENGEFKKVKTSMVEYWSKYVIIATGRAPRTLGLDGEKELYGKGLSHCALCDGNFFKKKDVAVVGGGNSALQEALYLSNICNKVYLLHRKDKFRSVGDIVSKVNEKENIVKIMEVNVEKINTTDDRLSSILLDNGKELNVSGLFLYVGFVPSTEFAKKLDITDDDGYIVVDKNYETEIKGIYAVGDIIKKDIYQISTAVGEGTIAATKIVNKINE